MAAAHGVFSDDESKNDPNATMNVLVLGPVGVGSGNFVTPSSNVLRAVLAALALAGPPGLSAGELFETVWGTRDARSMDSTLTVTVHRLRQWLRTATDERVSVTRTTTGYALRLSEGEVDAHRFLRLADAAEPLDGAAKVEALGAALALWRGPALVDVPDGSADQASLVRLELRRVTAVVDYARALLSCGQSEQAVQALSPLVESYPLDERVIGAWIEALAATGRQADALDAYERLRLRLRDEMGADPGRALSQALTRVLRQEVTPDEPQQEADQADARRDVLVPAQLPADTYAFTGRTEMLARLDALGRDVSAPGHAVRIAALTGAGGVGKTALAVHWARGAASSFPDGQLYANLHGYSAAPPERPISVLGRFLRALGISGGSVPVDLDEAGALYRSLLTGRRVLVVLDNAADPAQVRPLLPGADGCRVLVTSRDRLDGLVALDGAQPIGLDVLTEREAVDLLARVLGPERTAAEPEAVRDVVLACARLPLALRIAAAQLVVSPERAIAEFAAQLNTEGARLDALALSGDPLSQVRAVFDLSYERLDPEARRLFRMIGMTAEVDLTVESAAALLGSEPAEAELTLDRLAAAHLVTAHLPDRYDCHDLLRDYAAERAEIEDPAAEREGTARRLADWYTAGVERAVDLVYPDRDRLPEPVAADGASTAASFGLRFEEIADALDWLRAEHRNILSVIRDTADRAAAATAARVGAGSDGPAGSAAGAGADVWSNAWRLTWLLRPNFYAAELHLDWFSAVTSAERSLAGRTEPLGSSVLDMMRGDMAQLSSEPTTAIEYYARATEPAHAAGWLLGAATAQMRLANAYWEVGDLEATKACFTQSLEWYRECGAKHGQARATGNLGLVHCDTGPLSAAVELLTQYDESRIELGFARARAQSLCGLGFAHWRAGDYLTARRLLHQALDLAEGNGETHIARLAHCDLVAVDCALGDYTQARYHAGIAESLGEQTRTPRAVTQTLFAWGKIHEGEGDYERAREYFDEVVHRALAHDDSDHELCGLIGGAAARRALGAPQEALHLAQQALALAHERSCRVYESEALIELAQAHLALGHLDRAHRQAERALTLSREIERRLGEAQALRALGDVLDQVEGERAALPHWQAAHALFTELGSPEAQQVLARRP